VADQVDGPGSGARFKLPRALASDGSSLFVCDYDVIRQIELPSMRVTTLVGRRDCMSAIDGDHAHAALGGLVSGGTHPGPTGRAAPVAATWPRLFLHLRFVIQPLPCVASRR
jgi:hypothetical protein